MLTNEDIARIDEHCDARYRKLDACDERHKDIDDTLGKMRDTMNALNEKLAIQITKTSISNKWLGVIATAIIGAIITVIATNVF